VTTAYVVVTQQSLKESEASRRHAEKGLEEQITSRLESKRPLIIFCEYGSTYWKLGMTNVGVGPALRLDVRSNIQLPMDTGESDWKQPKPSITGTIFEKNLVESDALPPSRGLSPVQQTLGGYDTPLNLFIDRNLRIVAVYEDIFGTGYGTVVCGNTHRFPILYDAEATNEEKDAKRVDILSGQVEVPS
jgi:hypothetical protein